MIHSVLDGGCGGGVDNHGDHEHVQVPILDNHHWVQVFYSIVSYRLWIIMNFCLQNYNKFFSTQTNEFLKF